MKESEEFLDFLKMFKALKINLSLLEVLEKRAKYAKFLRDVISRRQKIGGGEQIALNAECSAMVSRMVLLKLKDSDNFTIPIEIGGVNFGRVLCT
ncbi:hypothetical protein PVK06_019934 [Gossypium arboreum]|uniref:Uncharacterized protein n=1 Tax=Gossypium arboreum TaxID=29729 RepID=A0ABR0PLE7_GOSAR|nr:hypothetical protein PVK06_019934 [Gossypium arboreum]